MGGSIVPRLAPPRNPSYGARVAKLPRDCPCSSGKRYVECCKGRHDGTRPAETPDALMRSRYAAFALGLGAYLVDTLAAGHSDRAVPPIDLARELGRAKDTQRFMCLRICHASVDGD